MNSIKHTEDKSTELLKVTNGKVLQEIAGGKYADFLS